MLQECGDASTLVKPARSMESGFAFVIDSLDVSVVVEQEHYAVQMPCFSGHVEGGIATFSWLVDGCPGVDYQASAFHVASLACCYKRRDSPPHPHVD